ncbi:MAG: GNAT family N-acetyltransferase [Azonexus sp.]|jgi:GNAT superfamily N-acetyltransferase|nr:GNAT family N-acetyltransferase [Azonexus sp.]
MASVPTKALRKLFHQGLRRMLAALPRETRFAVYRSFVDCDPAPSQRLQLKIAETREELEASFTLLHDAYVNAGFMKPDPSGMRVTLYHALPTTTTLCAKWDGEVVGTISLIRESVFGFPLQKVFDLSAVRGKGGNLAEVSALAVHPQFRKTGGAILFPLMKFMYEYSSEYFDTRHLLIAVNPNRIEMYESLLFFERLTANVVDNYDFANGAPAVGAALDLYQAPAIMAPVYASRQPNKNLFAYFSQVKLPNLQLPSRRYFTTNDPVLTPELLDYFFNQRTQGFANLDDRKRALLHSIYDLAAYRAVLPELATTPGEGGQLRQHRRFSVKCPGLIRPDAPGGAAGEFPVQVIEVSEHGFQAYAREGLPLNTWSSATVQLGRRETSVMKALAVRDKANGFNGFYGFKVGEPDLVWRKFVNALERGLTHGDLENATLFLA